MRENYAQFQSGLAMLDRMYGDLDLGVTYRGDRTGTDIASITEVTRSSNCSRSSRKQGHEYVLVGDTLSQRPMLASLRTSISSSRRTQG